MVIQDNIRVSFIGMLYYKFQYNIKRLLYAEVNCHGENLEKF